MARGAIDLRRELIGVPTLDLGTLILSLVLVLLVAVSPLSVLVEGRNLEVIDFTQDVDAGGRGAWLLRVATLGILSGCLAVIALAFGRSVGAGRTALLVLLGYLVFFVTNSVTNAVFGTVPEVSIKSIYPLLILVAIYLQREDHERLLDVIKYTLAVVLVASLVLAPLMPSMTMRSYAPELRLPVVSFRFWGFGNSPNSTGPLALALIMLCIHRPFRSRVVQAAVIACAATILLLAQSQTAWTTALVIVPIYLLFRWFAGEGALARETGGFGWLAAMLVFVAIATYLIVSALSDGIANTALTGRGRIWRAAFDLFEDNPLFGFGPTAWDTAFRIKVGMPFAFTAHNQVLQSLSTAGLVGLSGWFFYLGTLVIAAARLAKATRGLAPALLVAFPFMRSFSEASFDFRVVTADEFILHMIVFVLMTGAWHNEMTIRSARRSRSTRYVVD